MSSSSLKLSMSLVSRSAMYTPQSRGILWMGMANYSTAPKKQTTVAATEAKTTKVKKIVVPVQESTESNHLPTKSKKSSKVDPGMSKKELKLINMVDKELKPARGPSAYTLYIKEQFASNKGASLSTISTSWAKLDNSAKESYAAKAIEMKKEVEKENEKLPTKPKKPITAYLHYVMSLRKLNPNVKYGELMVSAGEKWKELSEHEKKSFYDMVEKEKAVYEKNLKIYNQQVELVKNQIKVALLEKTTAKQLQQQQKKQQQQQ
ncbi:hypothetical protein SAMD00019534_104390 [Acytostelium subglobosum LB1]|uniref:hypothetical protein n=1 Tax=Acytostelium subglobosum LB1 TaxID=1410327 RepID=UPI000644EEC8|nr:hypothetical protein SAMD00019534_104390 [Acytostelium subglobosum LB1]GAM27264.1 hypothetical protein SAMD00019534_104390 [Acytostelium subglobosum LB1]|eukprot:XP_012749731.1 hypothetical protein SAMD00019534_104390 [Acytostelium subglobosum LB1]